MKSCPHCNENVAEEVMECPKCGIFFSKWNERESNLESGDLSKYSSIANATSSEFNWTILVIVAVFVAGLLLFVAHNAKEILKDI